MVPKHAALIATFHPAQLDRLRRLTNALTFHTQSEGRSALPRLRPSSRETTEPREASARVYSGAAVQSLRTIAEQCDRTKAELVDEEQAEYEGEGGREGTGPPPTYTGYSYDRCAAGDHASVPSADDGVEVVDVA